MPDNNELNFIYIDEKMRGLMDMSKCEICDKSITFGKKVSMSRSHVSRRTNNMQKPNIRKVRVEFNGTAKSMYVCTRCLRSNAVTRIRN